MATKKITTSFTVTFSSSSNDGILIAEVDEREVADGGLNTKTSFAPGDAVAYLIFRGTGVTIDDQYHSYGSHVSLGAQIPITKEESVTFYGPDQLEQTLKYPVHAIVSYEWVGNSPFGTPKFNNQTVSVKLPTSVTYAAAILKVKYTSMADPFKLVHAPLGYTEYEIATLVVGTYDPTVV